MSKFRYQVVDAKGKESSGTIEAGSKGDAARLLKADGKFVASLETDTGPSILNMEIGRKKLKTKE